MGALLIGAVACGDANRVQQELLLSELREAETNRGILSETVAGRRSKIAAFEQRLHEQQAGLKSYQDQVKAYMMNHKLAVAAIAGAAGGGAVALDPDNAFSDEARAVGGVVGVLSVLYAASNFEEVSAVFDQLVQADLHVKRLEAQLATTEADLQTEHGLMLREEEELQGISTEVDRIRSELQALR